MATYTNVFTTGTAGADTYNFNREGITGAVNAGAGSDVAKIAYQKSAFTVTTTTTGVVSLTSGSGGLLKFTNFEKVVFADGQTIQIGSVAANTITGTAYADEVYGLAGNDILNGGNGIDKLYGGDGADKLAGGAGNDILTGGTGVDIFLFNTARNASTNVDTIKDYDVGGADKIQLDATFFNVGIAGTTAGAALTADKFWVGTAAHDATDRIIYNKATGALSYDADGNGAGAAVKFAIVGTTTHATLTAADFTIVP